MILDRMKKLALAALCCVPAAAQCFNWETTYIEAINYVARENGNSVFAYAENDITGTDAPYWQVRLSTQFYKNDTLLDAWYSGTNMPLGESLGRWYRRTPQTDGPGTYRLNSYHTAYNPYCLITAPPYGSDPSWDGRLQNSLQVMRPAPPGFKAGGPNKLWYLGHAIPYNGQYSAEAYLTPGDPYGAPEVPKWIFKRGAEDGFVRECPDWICAQPLFRTLRRASSCDIRNVVLVTSYNGFESEEFGITIDAPYRALMVADYLDPASFWKLPDRPDGNGWYTRFNYETVSFCGEQMSQYDMNETFGTWSDDYYAATGTHTSWFPPDCSTNPQSYYCGFSVGDAWQDEMWFPLPRFRLHADATAPWL